MDDVYVAESAIHGAGVFAAREFAAGETVLVLDDSRVVDGEHPLRPELGEYEYHCDYLEGGKVVLQGFNSALTMLDRAGGGGGEFGADSGSSEFGSSGAAPRALVAPVQTTTASKSSATGASV